jgi:glycosyltransferase involved in cell wall biosynthesis
MLLQLSCELMARGHQLFLIAPERKETWLVGEAKRRGISVILMRPALALDPREPFRLASILRSNRIDVLHAHMFAAAVIGSVAARIARSACVITLHTGAEQTQTRRRRLGLMVALRLSHATTVVSEKMRIDLIESLGSGATRAIVVPNGVPKSIGSRSLTRRELGINDFEVVVLAVGSCCKRKNQAMLVDALALLPHGLSWRLVIAGREDDGSQAINDAIQRHQVADRVSTVGVREDVENLLAAADVFAMPSTWEGMPLALAEAMMAGLPSVVSNVGGMPEMVEENQSGFIVPELAPSAFAAPLASLVDSADLRKRMGQHAAMVAAKLFSVEAMTDRYVRIYSGAYTPRRLSV